MRRVVVVVVLAAVAVMPGRMAAQPPVGGASLIPDGPGRYAIRNQLGQRKGTLVETAPGIFQLRDEAGRLSDWKMKKRADGGWDYVPSPFGNEKSK